MPENCCSVTKSWLFATPWTGAHQAPLSMEFPRQEYWRVLPFPSPGDPPDPRSEPRRHGNPHICYFSLIHDDAVLFYITLPTYVANSFNIILKVLVVQLCLTLCNLKECILPGSSVHRILQARLPSPGYLPNPGTEPGSPPFQADYLLSELPGKPSFKIGAH